MIALAVAAGLASLAGGSGEDESASSVGAVECRTSVIGGPQGPDVVSVAPDAVSQVTQFEGGEVSFLLTGGAFPDGEFAVIVRWMDELYMRQYFALGGEGAASLAGDPGFTGLVAVPLPDGNELQYFCRRDGEPGTAS